MSLTGQQTQLITIMKELNRPAKISELMNLYNTKYKEEIGVGIYKQIQRLVEDGYLKRVDRGDYELTDLAKGLLSDKKKQELPTLNFTKIDVDEFKKLSENQNVLQVLVENLNPSLIGLENERLGILAALVSTNDKEGDRNRVSVLIEGDVSSGKTSIIKWCFTNLWGFWADSNAKEAALKGSGRGFQTTPGLLNKADLSTLYIDELDKMDPRDQNSLLSAISEGFVPINKDGVNTILPARVRIIATSNDSNRIIKPLLSRFDLKFYTKKISPEDIDRMIRKKGNEWDREKDSINPGFLKKYLQYARQLDVELPEDRTIMNDYIIREKNTGVLQGKDIRAIEALYRLTIAIARLKLKKAADLDDLKMAIGLMNRE
jgi:DNA replicative helicase MCM subunit Mcm2 (Cdc46/Mcm family)